MPEIQLTAGSVPHFPLRWDLAKELCWVEFKRTPLSFADYAIWARRRAAEGEESATYGKHVAFRKNFPIRNDYAVYAFRRPRARDPTPVFEDWDLSMTLEYDGLFREILIRANVACGLAPDDPSPIVVSPSVRVSAEAIFPPHFVHFSAKDAVAHVLPWDLRGWALNPCK